MKFPKVNPILFFGMIISFVAIGLIWLEYVDYAFLKIYATVLILINIILPALLNMFLTRGLKRVAPEASPWASSIEELERKTGGKK